MGDQFPSGLQLYKRTLTFSGASVPPGLLKDHSTPILTPEGPPGVVEPSILYRVEPRSEVRFHVEFFSPSEST